MLLAAKQLVVNPGASDATTGTVSTNSGTFTDLLRVNAGAALSVTLVAPVAGFIVASFDAMIAHDDGPNKHDVSLQLLLDGVAVVGSNVVFQSLGDIGPVSFTRRIAVTAGSRVVKVQWAIDQGTPALAITGPVGVPPEPGNLWATLVARFTT